MSYVRIPEELKKKRGPKGPSKYTPEFLDKEALELIKYINETTIPWEEEFCGMRGYHTQRMTEFERSNENFSEALKTLRDKRKLNLVRGGLANKINTAMAIFALKNVAGWRDKAEFESNASLMITIQNKSAAGFLTDKETNEFSRARSSN